MRAADQPIAPVSIDGGTRVPKPTEPCHKSMNYGVCKLPKGHKGKHSRKPAVSDGDVKLLGAFLGEFLVDALEEDTDARADELATRISGSGEFASNKMTLTRAQMSAALDEAMRYVKKTAEAILKQATSKYAEPDEEPEGEDPRDVAQPWNMAKRAARGE